MKKVGICHVCARPLGSKFYNENDTCVVVRDPLGNEKRCHRTCEKDSDGKRLRTERVHQERKSDGP